MSDDQDHILVNNGDMEACTDSECSKCNKILSEGESLRNHELIHSSRNYVQPGPTTRVSLLMDMKFEPRGSQSFRFVKQPSTAASKWI